ncbi:MAG TPA: asparagine synthase (glutamine-hydrolyzing), partial [Flavisolibacter sp.]|nr:asparagine synthase (glutamine-hydrolyzing) [Flavisolibacter sp.]
MCGIIGSVNHRLSNHTVQLIHHRGPDEFGEKKLAVNGHSIELYHHRLSILDLSSNGSQPMASYDNKGLIVFNGEIYNHEDIKARLVNVPFRGHSDTETLVNLCRKDCSIKKMAELNGIFAFAYLDTESNKLYLARDRFGVKPLYYYFDGRKVIFSSELRAISCEVYQSFSIGSITTALKFRYVPAPETMYRKIFKVEPGQLVTINLGEMLVLSKSLFADLPKQASSGNSTKKQLVKEYGQLLEKAVERQLLSDVEVGIFLSGGIDSSLIAAIAKSKMKNIKAFTVGFDDKKLDERESAGVTAAYLGLDHYTETVKFNDFFEEFKMIANIIEEPVDTGSIFSMYTLS